jgi:hypothetical protein
MLLARELILKTGSYAVRKEKRLAIARQAL